MEILQEFKGIIGTVVGVLITLLITEIKKRSGKVSINAEELKLDYIKRDDDNFSGYKDRKVIEIDSADYFKYDLKLVLYNGSEILRNLYNIKIRFVGENEREFIHVPKDFSTKKVVGGCKNFSDIGVINLEPHNLFPIHLLGSISNEKFTELLEIGTIKSIYFDALNHKNKSFSIEIFEHRI